MTTSARRTNRVPGHRIAWYVWAWGNGGPAVKMRHQRTMCGTWGWDAECSCGWKSHTGGATKGWIRQEIFNHMWDVADDAQRNALIGLDR